MIQPRTWGLIPWARHAVRAAATVEVPGPDLTTFRFLGRGAHGRYEAHEKPSPALDQPTPEGVAQEVESGARGPDRSVISPGATRAGGPRSRPWVICPISFHAGTRGATRAWSVTTAAASAVSAFPSRVASGHNPPRTSRTQRVGRTFGGYRACALGCNAGLVIDLDAMLVARCLSVTTRRSERRRRSLLNRIHRGLPLSSPAVHLLGRRVLQPVSWVFLDQDRQVDPDPSPRRSGRALRPEARAPWGWGV